MSLYCHSASSYIIIIIFPRYICSRGSSKFETIHNWIQIISPCSQWLASCRVTFRQRWSAALASKLTGAEAMPHSHRPKLRRSFLSSPVSSLLPFCEKSNPLRLWYLMIKYSNLDHMSSFMVYTWCHALGWQRGSMVRTSVYGWRTFPDLFLIYGWHVTALWVKCLLWVNQANSAFHPSSVRKWVAIHVIIGRGLPVWRPLNSRPWLRMAIRFQVEVRGSGLYAVRLLCLWHKSAAAVTVVACGTILPKCFMPYAFISWARQHYVCC